MGSQSNGKYYVLKILNNAFIENMLKIHLQNQVK